MNESISVINSIELIPLEETDINPLLTKVRIKVFHLGENRNHSYIDKPTALSMAKTLRGNPIVARYREEDKDFTDHGQEIVINDKGISYKTLTRPYGYVGEKASVWFEDFDDTDENGQIVRHTYVVTEGYIWTQIYKELNDTIMEGGRPQSMELDEETLQGSWSNSINSNYEIFIINDAIITSLCALGENVEPCFLGASIKPIFSQLTNESEEGFVKELIELKTKFNLALNSMDKGGQSMEENTVEVQAVETEVVEDTSAVVEETKVEENLGETETLVTAETEETTVEFKKEEKEEEKSEEKTEEDEKSDEDKKDESEEEDKKTKHSLESEYALLKGQYDELVQQYASLEQSNKELVAFKNAIEDKEKDELIAKFYMLSDEDKKNVVENKANFTLDEIEKELSVICVRKKVSFANEEETENKINITSYTVNNSAETEVLPSWLQAVEAHKTQN